MSFQLLAGRTPLTARRLTYVGADRARFEDAYLARNPQAVFAAPGESVEVLVLADLDAVTPQEAAAAAAALEAGGYLVTASRSGAQVAATLAALGDGFRIAKLQFLVPGDDYFNDLAPRRDPATVHLISDRELLLVAQRLTAAHPPPPEPLVVQSAAFAPRLMDIRTRLPAHALRGDPELIVAYAGAPVQLLPLPPETPKILVLQRPALRSLETWRAATANSIRGGWVPVLEIDDHPVLLAAVGDRKMTAEDWRLYGFPHAIQTSTEPLARVFSKYNPVVKVFSNAIFDLPPFPTAPAPRRVFYGALSRGRFAVRMAGSLGAVAEAFPEVEFVVVGDREVFEALPMANKAFHDYLPYDDYLALMAASAVSLSPIEGRLHEDTKSDAKFLDAASRGVVTLASPTVYAGTLEHGRTGLIARRLKDWAPLLAEALGDEPARQAMARRAWDYVRAERMFAHQAADRAAWYRELWDRRAELNAGVIARLPGLAQALEQAFGPEAR